MASELLRIRVRADAGNTQGVLSDISRSLLGMSVGAAGARSGLMGLAAALGGAQITGRLASAAFGAVAYGVYSIGNQMIGAAGEVDQFKAGLNSLLRDKPLVDAMTRSIVAFADSTTFANQEVFSVATSLTAARVPLANLIPTMQMLADVSMGSAEKFKGISTAWVQMISKGKITSEEINQIAERGVGVWAILAEETGKSIPQLQKMAEQGQLSVQAFLPILQGGMAKKYAGSMKEASTLSTVVLEQMGKAVTGFARAIGSGLDSTVNPFLNELLRLFKQAKLYAEALVSSNIWQRFAQSLQAAADAAMPLIRVLGLVGFVALIRAVQLLTPAIWLAAGAFRGIASAAQALFRYFKPLFDVFSLLAQRIKNLNWQGLWQAIKTQSPDIWTRIGQILVEIIKQSLTWAQTEAVPALKTFAGKVLDDLVTAIRENPGTALGIAVVNLLRKLIPIIREANIGRYILPALFGGLDIKAGIESGNMTQIGQGIVEIVAGAIIAAKFGGFAGLVGSMFAGAIYDDILVAVNAQGPERWAAIWQVVGDIGLVALAVFPWSQWIGRALTALGGLIWTGLLAAFTWASRQLAAFILAGWLAPALAGAVAAIGLFVVALAYRFYRLFVDGWNNIDWVNIGVILVGLIGAGLTAAFGAPLWVAALAGALILTLGGVLWEAMVAAWEYAKPYVVSLIDTIGIWWSESVESISIAVSEAFTGLWTAIRDGVEAAWLTAVGILESWWPSVVTWWTTNISDPSTGLWSDIEESFGSLWEAIKDGFNRAWDIAVAEVDAIWQTIKTAFTNWIIDPGLGLWYAILDSLSKMWEPIRAGFASAWEAAIAVLIPIWEGIKSWFGEMITLLGEKIESGMNALWSFLVEGFQSAWDNAIAPLLNIIVSIWNWFSGQVYWLGGQIETAFSNLGSFIVAGVQKAWDSAKSGVEGIANSIKNFINDAITGASTGSAAGKQATNESYWARKNYYKGIGLSDSEADKKARQDVPGYATGGSFVVGGAGGTDSQMVAFRATPGEQVTIFPPGRAPQSGVTIGTINVYADSYEGGQAAARAIRDALGVQRKMMFLTT